jgi:Tol biopolymer transport system component
MPYLSLLLLVMAASAAAAQTPASQAENARNPVVSPDGRHIAIISKRDGTPDLYVIDADGGGRVRLSNTAETEGIAGWSADGSQVRFMVFKQDTAHLYSVGRDGTGLTRIGGTPGRANRVSRDGSFVVYGAGPYASMQLFTARVDGSNARRITPGTSAFWCHALSADGQRVAASRSDSGKLEIWVMSLDGSGSRQVTQFSRERGRGQCPSWSPDGRRLAVQGAVRHLRDSTRLIDHIFVVDVETGTATKLAEHHEPFGDETPSWFPDGRRIAFQSNRSGSWEIWTINADGTGLRQITR